MRVERLLPSREASALLDMVGEVADGELGPRAGGDEAARRFPRDALRTPVGLGIAGCAVGWRRRRSTRH